MEQTPIRRDVSPDFRDVLEQHSASPDGNSRKRKRATSAFDKVREKDSSRRHRLDKASCPIDSHGSSDSEIVSYWETRRSQRTSEDSVSANDTIEAADLLRMHRRLDKWPAANDLCYGDHVVLPANAAKKAHSMSTINGTISTEPLSMGAETQITASMPSSDRNLPSNGSNCREIKAVSLGRSPYTQAACANSGKNGISHSELDCAAEASPTASNDRIASRKDHHQNSAIHRSDADEDEDELTRSTPDRVIRSAGPIVIMPDVPNAIDRTDDISLDAGKNGDDVICRPKNNDITYQRASLHDKENIRDSGSDYDDDIGIPKEQYKPKPSRSRSGRTTGDLLVPTDYSKRPEAIAKSTTHKRSRAQLSADHHSVRTSDQDAAESQHSEPIDAVKDPSKHQHIEKHKNASKADKMTSQSGPPNQTEVSSLSNVAPKKQRGRPRKVECIKGEKGPSQGWAVLEKECATLESLHEREIPISLLRPVQESPMNDSGQRGLVAGEMTAGCNSEQPDNVAEADPAALCPENMTLAGLSHAKQSETLSPPETPTKPAKTAEKGPDRHSPISNSKVAFRVGLSKRARIAPLLKTVRG